jgi:hypothetical protein
MVSASSVARAQTVTVDVQGGSVSLGQVSGSASGTTVFRITPAGSVSVASGTGKRVTTGSVSTPTVTVKCTDGSGSSRRCTANPVYVTLRGTGSTGVANTPTTFTVSSAAGVSTGPTGSNPTTYKLTNFTNNETRTFNIGMDVGIKSSATVGNGTFAFSAAAGFSSPASSPVDSGSGSLYGVRPMSLAKISNLDFGRVVKPASGSTELRVTTGGARTLTGGDAVLVGSSFSRAQYTATGEGGQAISITAPAFNMTNGTGGSVTVTPILPSGLTGLSGAAGSNGSYSFFVGGRFTMTPTTPSGGYTGSFSVSVAYN